MTVLHAYFLPPLDLLKVDGEVYGSYADAFHACEREHTHPEDCYTDLQDLDDDSDSEMDDDDEEPQEEDEDTTVKAIAKILGGALKVIVKWGT